MATDKSRLTDTESPIKTGGPRADQQAESKLTHRTRRTYDEAPYSVAAGAVWVSRCEKAARRVYRWFVTIGRPVRAPHAR